MQAVLSPVASRRGLVPAPEAAAVLGTLIPLRPVAGHIAEHYFEEHPDHWLQYGAGGFDWCRYGNQWLLYWAAEDLRGGTDLCEQAAWLARFLHARGGPTSFLVRDLQIASRVAPGPFGAAGAALAECLMFAAQTVAALDLD